MKKITAALMGVCLIMGLQGQVFAQPDVDIHNPITVDNGTIFEAGEVEGGTTGNRETEGQSGSENTTSSQNNLLANEAYIKKTIIIDNYDGNQSIWEGDNSLIIQGDRVLPRWELVGFVELLLGFDKVPGLVPVGTDPTYGGVSITNANGNPITDTDNISKAMEYIKTNAGITGHVTGTSQPVLNSSLAGVSDSLKSVLEGPGPGAVNVSNWSDELHEYMEIPVYGIEPEYEFIPGSGGIHITRPDLGGMIDEGNLESRYSFLDLYLQHLALTEQIETTHITEYRITSETQEATVQTIPQNEYVWYVEDEGGNMVAGPIYTQGRYLRFVFNRPGTFLIRAEQMVTQIIADVVTYDKNEYWVLNNGDAWDGQIIYKNRQTDMTYYTQTAQEQKQVPVNLFQQEVTDDMVGSAYISGPNGLVGMPRDFYTQRY